MDKKNILVIGANFTNKGAEAMLKTVRNELSKRMNCGIFYMVCHPSEKELAIQNGFSPVCSAPENKHNTLNKFLKRAYGKIRKTLGMKPLPFVEVLPHAAIRSLSLQMVIDVSGYAYGDFRGAPQTEEVLKLVDYCKKKSIPFFFLPQAWGSFKNKSMHAPVRKMLLSCDTFYSRDIVSSEYLSEVLNKPISEINQLPDIALCFSPEDHNNSITPYLEKFSLARKDGKLLFVISPNMRIVEKYHLKGSNNPYLQTLIQLATFATEHLNMTVVLLPNEMTYDNRMKDDRFICRLIHEQLGNNKNTILVDGYYSADQIRSLIAEADLLASSRFHSLVFGLASGIPCMAISWSHKYRELLGLFNLREFVIDYEKARSEDANDMLSKLTANRKMHAAEIKDKLPGYQMSIRQMFNTIAHSHLQ